MSEKMTKELAEAALKSGDGVPVEQIKALYKSGGTVDLIARALKIDEALVKSVINSDLVGSCANGKLTFTEDELATVKSRLMQAITAGSENVSAKVAMFIAGQHMVSAVDQLRIEKGLDTKQGIAVNIMNVLQQAAETAKKYG